MVSKKQKIVVLGAGFAGLRTALSLSKLIKKNNLSADIILIDERDRHIYTPDLYEIATAYHAKITPECLTKLKDSVAIPITQIIANTGIEFIRDRIKEIKEDKKIVALMTHGELSFDYLVITLGSVVNFYDIPGLEEYAFPLKTVTHALAINCHIDQFFQKLWDHQTKESVSIIVGGGGPTGVELAAELPTWIDRLCKKFTYDRSLIKVHLIEAGKLLGGKNEKASPIIVRRLQKLGINVHTETAIRNVNETSVRVEHADKSSHTMPMNIMLWTGGVKPNPLLRTNFSEVTANGALPTNEYLQYIKNTHIYAAGDNAYIFDSKTNRPAPLLAQLAFDQGKVIAINIVADLLAVPSGDPKKYETYSPKIKGLITPLGGKYAIFTGSSFVVKGFWMWVLRRLVDLRYALSILPFFYAIKKWLHDTNVFVQNDA